ncbi:lantibiotic dehydratase [Streptomyces kanamyceticus]|uniref:Lantibiotic dehydratase n=1 Tax=Streptomyces kanamyceticus TaxID=1967 RepID=A0A5J6GEK6_STRKN|nr:lantibiotic dehydratase [Streptomyces kanamyceticus]QEU92892.1 lantibiotic dehydratase [Streptomyces kanamyceticus]
MTLLYRHTGVALLRSTALPLTHAPTAWPDFANPDVCRSWLRQVWGSPGLAQAISQASPALAVRVVKLLGAEPVRDRQVRQATAAVMRYLLRATGRPTPFALFAGVAPVHIGPDAYITWGAEHRPFARVGAEWLADIVERLENLPAVLDRLEVEFSNLAVQRGTRIELPHGPARVSVRHTEAVQAVRDATVRPSRVSTVADKIASAFPEVPPEKVRALLAELVRRGFLITGLRAPFTVTDALGHVVNRLREAHVDRVGEAVPLLRLLESVQADVTHHNADTTAGILRARLRNDLTGRMREVSKAGRTPLSVDLRLDCQARIPESVAHEAERAASVIARLTRQPVGQAVWRDFHAAFCDHFGIDTLVPLADVIDPDTGIGYPAGYPGSTRPEPPSGSTAGRDEHLLSLAWQAAADHSREIVLTEETITALTIPTGGRAVHVPPHVELSARILAASPRALERGEFTLIVAPARAAGTLTSRFTTTASGTGLEDVYRNVPAATEGALPVQLSFPPIYPHAENICRVPAYLDHVLPLGEHRGLCPTAPDEGTEAEIIALDDLAVTATRDALHLVSLSRRRVVEPQVFHALSLGKQPPPLARFLAHLPRAFTVGWHEFDWGPHTARLPHLPRVRYGRTILSSARWRLAAAELPSSNADLTAWRRALKVWRERWHCPARVELRDADRTLRLDLNEASHAALLRSHLARRDLAELVETAQSATEYGWLRGHTHELALPLVTTQTPRSSPRLDGPLPIIDSRSHGHLPAAPGSRWLYAKIWAHPERHEEIIGEHLPRLIAELAGDPTWWFVRYRSATERDHLRLRIRSDEFAASAEAIGTWAENLRARGLCGGLALDTYRPESGRYGGPAAIEAAEAVFAADSRAVLAEFQHPVDTAPAALVALNMWDICHDLLGGTTEAVQWLTARRAPDAVPDRTVTEQVTSAVRGGRWDDPTAWPAPVITARLSRRDALARYRSALPPQTDVDTVLESLLHMHHNRALGIDRERERACRRMTRHAALALRAAEVPR